MPKRKAEVSIGYRAWDELVRICGESERKKVQALGCDRKTFYGWKSGTAPDAMYLVRLHYLGADVIYILTGVRNGRENKE